MAHPTIGLPLTDTDDARPETASRLREMRRPLARRALEATLRIDPTFDERYDETDLRLFLRDFDQHIEQVAKALETGRDSYVEQYGEWLVPIYRRREVPMRDFRAMIAGLRDAARPALPAEDAAALDRLVDGWQRRLRHHGRIPGDHKGNALVRFFWKGAGIGDESIV
jgi:hypothetical protein